MLIDEDYSKSIKDQILSFNQRKQPSLISIGVIPSTHNDIIVALDSNGILNAYNITNESLSNGNNDTYLEAIQSNNNNYIYPNASFYFNDSNYLQGIFTSMEIENNTVYITGNFQTISLSSKEILEGVWNKNNSKIPLIPINCTSLTQYEDFNVNERRMIGCDIKDNHLLSYSDEGRLFLFDINSKKPISSTHINGYKMNTAKIDEKDNSIVHGGHSSNIYFNDLRSFQLSSVYSIESNIHRTGIKQYTQSNEYTVNSILLSEYYYLISCNNFFTKYSNTIKASTNVYLSNSPINTIYKDNDNVLTGGISKNIIKYPITLSSSHIKKLRSDVNNITSIKKCYLFNDEYYIAGGSGNIMNIFATKNNEESVLKLIF